MKIKCDEAIQILKGKLICQYNNQSMIFSDPIEFSNDEWGKNKTISCICVEDGILSITQEDAPVLTQCNTNTNWEQEHFERTGHEPNLFDGV